MSGDGPFKILAAQPDSMDTHKELLFDWDKAEICVDERHQSDGLMLQCVFSATHSGLVALLLRRSSSVDRIIAE